MRRIAAFCVRAVHAARRCSWLSTHPIPSLPYAFSGGRRSTGFARHPREKRLLRDTCAPALKLRVHRRLQRQLDLTWGRAKAISRSAQLELAHEPRCSFWGRETRVLSGLASPPSVRGSPAAVLVDCGPSFVAQRQPLSAWSLGRLKAVAITHFHGDHPPGCRFFCWLLFRVIAHRTEKCTCWARGGVPNACGHCAKPFMITGCWVSISSFMMGSRRRAQTMGRMRLAISLHHAPQPESLDTACCAAGIGGVYGGHGVFVGVFTWPITPTCWL
jgi:hypothetical protein